MGAYIIFTDSLSSIEGLKSTGLSYRMNDMLFRARKSLRYLGELGYDISLMWIPSHVGILGNERAHVLVNEGATDHSEHVWHSHSRKDQTADRMAGKMEWQQNGPLLIFDSTEGLGWGIDGFHGRQKSLFDGDV
jgi:ribonuclease HI